MKKTPIYGHRGCRSLYPENSLEGFQYALNLGIQGIELDVVISKDKQVVLSHEPWMDKRYCLDKQKNEIDTMYNLFKMDYTEIQEFDTGSKFYINFPLQEKIQTYKPLLKELIDLVNQQEKAIFFILELKSEKEWDTIFQPSLTEYVELVETEIQELNPRHELLIQSFDPKILNKYHHLYSYHSFGLLVENENSIDKNLSLLDFKPHFYNQDFQLLSPKNIQYLHSLNIQTIAWTINDKDIGNKLIEWKIDGIITDNPTIFIQNL